MNIDTFKDKIRDFVVGAIDDTSVTVIHAHQPQREDDAPAAPTPERPFVAIQLAGRGHVGTDSHWMDGETMQYNGDREQTVTFRIFGGTNVQARDISDAIEQGLERHTTREVLTDAGIGMAGIENMISQDEVHGKGWENRAHIDVTFRYGEDYTDDPGVIEQVGLTGTLDPGDEDASQSITIEY